jgi:hydrogenase expression/formation protein HypD
MIDDAIKIVKEYKGKKLRIMEVCGTHTHEIFKLSVRQLLSEDIDLISGPGCPVCVTQVDYIDEAVMLALEKNVTICSFGDLLKVPGTKYSLSAARGQGAKVQVVYAPLDAVKYAKEHPDEEVVFLSVGFETTVPSSCIALQLAIKEGVKNFSLLTANKTMPVAYRAMKNACDCYLYPGHVHAIIGTGLCEELRDSEGISGVVAGFTPKELVTAIAVAVTKLQEEKPFFVNCYPRVVKPEGSPAAVKLIYEYMESSDEEWRGLGTMPGSGLKLKDKYSEYDARIKFAIPPMHGHGNPACRCASVLKGEIKPYECPCFGKVCTPEHTVGACMVSDEGACSAWYLYGGLDLK